MSNRMLYTIWGCLFIICAALGFIPGATGILALILGAVSLAFFVPPALLLWRAGKRGDRVTRQIIRNFSLASLGLTLLLLILNVVSAMASPAVGNVLHCLLVVISTPMICSGYWAVSLFLWACLLMASLKK